MEEDEDEFPLHDEAFSRVQDRKRVSPDAGGHKTSTFTDISADVIERQQAVVTGNNYKEFCNLETRINVERAGLQTNVEKVANNFSNSHNLTSGLLSSHAGEKLYNPQLIYSEDSVNKEHRMKQNGALTTATNSDSVQESHGHIQAGGTHSKHYSQKAMFLRPATSSYLGRKFYGEHSDNLKYGTIHEHHSKSQKPEDESPVDSCHKQRDSNSFPESGISTTSSSHESSKDENTKEEPFSLRKLPRQEKLIVVVNCLTYLLAYLCISIMAPFYPNEIERRNISTTLSGWVFSAFPLTQFIAAPLIGKILPELGNMQVLLTGCFLAGGSTLLFGFVSWFPIEEGSLTFLTMCFLLRIVGGIGSTSATTATFTFCVDHFSDNITIVFSISEVFVGIGMMIGPAVGGFLYSVGGFLFPFAIIGGIMLINVPIYYFLLRNVKNKERQPSPDIENPSEKTVTQSNKKISVWQMFLHPLGLVNSAAVVMNGATWSMLDPTLAPHLEQFDLDPEEVSLMFLLMAACYSISCPIFGHFSQKLPDDRIFVILGYALAAAALLLVGPSPLVMDINDDELWMNIIALIAMGVSASLSIVTTFDMYLEVAASLGFENNITTYSMVTGLFGSVYALGDFIGPSLGGLLTDTLGFEWCTTIVAMVCLFVTTITLISLLCGGRCSKRCILRPHSDDATRKAEVADETTSLLNSSPCVSEKKGLLETYPPRD